MDSLSYYNESDDSDSDSGSVMMMSIGAESSSSSSDAAAAPLLVMDSSGGGEGGEGVVICEMCNSKDRIYKCPRCGTGTCSLSCCRKHKVDRNCNGVRDRSSYISMKDFQEKNLRNDFHFLEDVVQSKKSAKRNVVSNFGGQRSLSSKQFVVTNKKYSDGSSDNSSSNNNSNSNSNSNSSSSDIPSSCLDMHTKQIKKLVNAAMHRQTKLLIMPAGMQKRARNTTYFDHKKRTIFWRFHAIFILGSEFQSKDVLNFSLDGSSEINYLPGNSCLVGTTFPRVREGVTIQSLLDLILGCNVADNVSLPCDTDASNSSSNSNSNSKDGDMLNSIPGLDPAKIANLRYTLRYLRKSHSSIQCYTQKLPSPAQTPLFYEIPLSFSIKDALEGKTVIEYPLFIFGLDLDAKPKLEISHFLFTPIPPRLQVHNNSSRHTNNRGGANSKYGISKLLNGGSSDHVDNLSKLGMTEVVCRKRVVATASSGESSEKKKRPRLRVGSSKRPLNSNGGGGELEEGELEEEDHDDLVVDDDIDIDNEGENEAAGDDDDDDDSCSDDLHTSGHHHLLGDSKQDHLGTALHDDAMETSEAIEEKEFMLALEEFADKEIDVLKAYIAKYESNDDV